MASKSRKRSKRRVPIDPLDQIRRSFERGDFKQALKDARVSYRRKATPALRSLLEHIYLGRADQLARQGLREDSRRILQELLELGVTEPAVEAGLPELYLAVGMLDHLPVDTLTGGERQELEIKIVDQAVLRPDDAPRGMPEIRRDAQRIRDALEAVERGDDSAALASLREIPRQSPFADWKFFVRGLIAYYRLDTDDMRANWDRLDDQRAAVRIAMPLKVMAGLRSHGTNGQLSPKVRRLEKQVTTCPVLGVFATLQQFSVQGNWRQVLRTLQRSGGELKKLDTDVYQRVVAWLCSTLVHEENIEDLERLTRIADPPLTDPNWNWARAAVRDDGEDWEALRYWKAYLADLDKVSALPSGERKLAQAMIHLHQAEYLAADVDKLRRCRCGRDHSEDIEDGETHAQGQFNQCLELAPKYRKGYSELADFHKAAGRSAQAAAVWRQWVAEIPDDTEPLFALNGYHLANNQPLEAREYGERLRELKPLDRGIGELLWRTCMAAARHFARQDRVDQAREQLVAADDLQPGPSGDYRVLALKAGLEIKADRPQAARAFLEQAQEVLAEPTALWLIMALEATRIELPEREIWLYEKRWHDALKRRCRGETAGRMCSILNDQLRSPESQDFDEQSEPYLEPLLKYVRRCSRVKWDLEDLRHVCQFLDATGDDRTLKKVLKRGLRSFPEAAYLHWFAAKVELDKGPLGCHRRKCKGHLCETIRLAAASEDPRDRDLAERAQRARTLLEAGRLHHYHDADDREYGLDEQKVTDFLDQLEGIPPEIIRRLVEDACESLDVDPEEIMEEIERRQAARTRRRS